VLIFINESRLPGILPSELLKGLPETF